MQSDLSTISTDIANLIRKHLLGTLSPEEHAKLAQWIAEDSANQQLFIRVSSLFKEDLELKDLCGEKRKEKKSFKTLVKRLLN